MLFQTPLQRNFTAHLRQYRVLREPGKQRRGHHRSRRRHWSRRLGLDRIENGIFV